MKNRCATSFYCICIRLDSAASETVVSFSGDGSATHYKVSLLERMKVSSKGDGI